MRQWVILVVAGAALAGCTSDPVEPSATPEAQPSPTPITEAQAAVATDDRALATARQVLTDIVAGEFAKVRVRFDLRMLGSLNEAGLAEAWGAYQERFGAFERAGDGEVVRRGSAIVVSIALVMGERPGQFRVSFDVDGRIAGLFFLEEGVPVP